MKETEIADLLVSDGQHDGPELVRVDIQVRSGGGIVPPSWAKSMRELRNARSNVKVDRLRKER